MNSPSTSGIADNRINPPAWQEEIKQLHLNFFVLDAIISGSSGLSCQRLRQYTALQQTIADTLERLLDELDQTDGSKAGPCVTCTKLLKKHAVVMRRLNARVDRLINVVTA